MSLPKPDFVQNMTLIGYSDIGGRGDGLQLMVHRGYAYIGHPWSQGFSIVDVRDPRNPDEVTYMPAPLNTWNIHLQTHDDLLLVINALDLFADIDTFTDENYRLSMVVDFRPQIRVSWGKPRSPKAFSHGRSRPLRPRKAAQRHQ